MSSPAHRAALGFLRGGLIATVSLALTPALGALASSVPTLGWLVKAAQFLLPVAGFAAGGALGGDALSLGPRGAMAFGCGGGAAGLVLFLSAPHLQGLTGFEDPLVVVPYAIATSALAFGAMGLIGEPGRPARQGRSRGGRLRRWRHRRRPARRAAVSGPAGGRPRVGGPVGVRDDGLLDWIGRCAAHARRRVGSAIVVVAQTRRRKAGQPERGEAPVRRSQQGEGGGGGQPGRRTAERRPQTTKAGESTLAPPGPCAESRKPRA